MILLGATAAFQIGRVPLNWDEDPISKIGSLWDVSDFSGGSPLGITVCSGPTNFDQTTWLRPLGVKSLVDPQLVMKHIAHSTINRNPLSNQY